MSIRGTLSALCILLAAAPAYALVGSSHSTTAPLQLEVMYKSQALATRADMTMQATPGVRSIKAADRIKPGLRIINYDSPTTLAAALKSFKLDPNVASVQRPFGAKITYVPNDPLYQSSQYDKQLQNLSVANDIETGQAPVLILIVDTGFDCTQHPDTAPNCRQDLSRDMLSGAPYHWHGFHTYGIAAASANNGVDIAGTAGTAQVAFCRFLDQNGNGSTANAVLCFDYAIQLQQAGYHVVVSNSWGSTGNDTNLQAADAAMHNAGLVSVAAAGNNGTDNCTTPFYPAVYQYEVSVAATDQNDALASFSNFGQCVLVAAPGVSVTSLMIGTNGAPPPETGVASGTSMATPQFAGAAALIWSQNKTLTNDQVTTQVVTAAKSISGLNVLSGKRVDLTNLLQTATPGFRLSTQCPVPAIVNAGSSMKCTVLSQGVGGFTDPITLTGGGVAGTFTFNPATINPGSSAQLTLVPKPSTGVLVSQMTVHGSADNGSVVNDATSHQVTIYPAGTSSFNYSNSAVFNFGKCKVFADDPAGFKCISIGKPVVTDIKSFIQVLDNNSVVHLSGVMNITWFASTLNITLTSPKGTVFNVPVPTNFIASGASYSFATDVFDGEPTMGTWTLAIHVPNANWYGELSGWSMSMLAAPIAPPGPPTVDWPNVTINWSSQNAGGCTLNGANVSTNGSETVIEPYGSYGLTCSNSAGSATKTLTIGVQ